MSRTRRSVRKEAGFTLVEMAIVLIIIGLIIGAILKGQDLIDNARGKRFASFARGAEVSQWAFYDRFGRFAGDDSGDGRIASAGSTPAGTDTENPSTTLSTELDSFSTSLNLGSSTFYPTFGVNGSKNFLALSDLAVSGSPTAFSDGAVIYAKIFDVAIDGTANAESGNVQGMKSLTIDANGIVTDANTVGKTVWDTETKGLIYYFD